MSLIFHRIVGSDRFDHIALGHSPEYDRIARIFEYTMLDEFDHVIGGVSKLYYVPMKGESHESNRQNAGHVSS